MTLSETISTSRGMCTLPEGATASGSWAACPYHEAFLTTVQKVNTRVLDCLYEIALGAKNSGLRGRGKG
jgi:hypothetical protein